MTSAPQPTSRVAIASGIVSEQASCTIDEAMQKMTETARGADCTLEQVAALVIDHQIRFN